MHHGFSEEHVERPTVRYDVMHHEENHAIVFTEMHNRSPEQRPCRKIKRSTRCLCGKPSRLGFLFVFRQAAQIYLADCNREARYDSLDRLAIHAWEGRAQNLVTADD